MIEKNIQLQVTNQILENWLNLDSRLDINKCFSLAFDPLHFGFLKLQKEKAWILLNIERNLKNMFETLGHVKIKTLTKMIDGQRLSQITLAILKLFKRLFRMLVFGLTFFTVLGSFLEPSKTILNYWRRARGNKDLCGYFSCNHDLCHYYGGLLIYRVIQIVQYWMGVF